jgi:hypothetical protein
MITLNNEQWSKIAEQIRAEYPPSVLMISWITRRELGFTVRQGVYGSGKVFLDFYDDGKEMWFTLRYL